MARGISSIVEQIQPSATLSLKEEISSLEKKYEFKIIDLTAGQPDTGPTEDVLAALVEGGKLHKYGPVQGDAELRQVLPAVLNEEVGVKYDPKDIAITIGAKGAIDILMRVLLNPGDGVGIMSPFWVTYPESVRLAHGIPCFLESTADLRPDIGRLSGELRSKNIKALLYSSPCNPSGVVYTTDELQAIAGIVKEQDIWVICDEIYRSFIFDDRTPASILQVEGMCDNTILVDGPSKRFGIPGWRLGVVAGPSEVIKAVTKLQGHTSSGASRPVQHAVCVAYTSQEARRASEEMRRRYQRNRDVVVRGLNEINGFSCATPEGAFYVFPNVAGFFGQRYEFDGSEYTVSGSAAFRTFLLRKAQVAGVEGAPFGMDGHIRFSLATKEEDCMTALASIRNAVREVR